MVFAADAAVAGVPARRDRQRRRARWGDRGRARLGEPGPRLREPVEHRAVAAPGGPGHRAGPAGVAQQRADDVVLPGRRARGAPRVRPRGAARPQAVPGAARGRGSRHAAAGAALPRGHARHRCRLRLGCSDVDGHRARARLLVGARSRRARPGARLPAHGADRRRPRRARRDRRLLQRPDLVVAAGRGRRRVRGLPRHAALRRRRPARLRRDGRGDLGRPAGERGRPGRGRADDRPGRLGVHPEPGHPRTRQQPVPRVPRGADRRAGPYGVRRADRRRCRRTPGSSASTCRGPAT